MLSVGDRVRLRTPDNPILDGLAATVAELTAWGARVVVERDRTERYPTGLGTYRALTEELTPYAEVNGPARARVQARDQGYTGDVCHCCGSIKMVRTGACSACQDCGTSGGCG